MKEKIKGFVFWILAGAVVLYFISQLYWPLFASAEVVGANTFNFAVIAFIIWRTYKFRHPKKNPQSEQTKE